MERAEALRIFEEADCLADRNSIETAIKNIATKITEKLSHRNPVVFCVMNGGLIFSGQLITSLEFPLELGYLHATRYGRDVVGGELEWIVKPQIELSGRTVLLLDDILDEGVTLKALADDCRERGATEVFTAVLVEKHHDRKVEPGFKADFTGFVLGDRFLFGYGLDYDGVWRNAPGIYAVKGL